jgi:hypothetical protein
LLEIVAVQATHPFVTIFCFTIKENATRFTKEVLKQLVVPRPHHGSYPGNQWSQAKAMRWSSMHVSVNQSFVLLVSNLSTPNKYLKGTIWSLQCKFYLISKILKKHPITVMGAVFYTSPP